MNRPATEVDRSNGARVIGDGSIKLIINHAHIKRVIEARRKLCVGEEVKCDHHQSQ